MADRETLMERLMEARLYRCQSCPEEFNCYPAEEVFVCDDGTWCEECWSEGGRSDGVRGDKLEATELDRLKAKVEELERERLKLRTSLIETGRNLGALLTENVSSDFLTLLPEEARLLKARLARAVEVMRPIAEAANGHDEPDVDWGRTIHSEDAEPVRVSLGDCRKVRAFLSEQENRHGNG